MLTGVAFRAMPSYAAPMAILVLEHSDLTGSGRLGEMLRDYGHRLTVVKLHQGHDLPPDLDDVDGVVTCGGPQHAYDDSLPWLADEMTLLRQARERDIPIVAICLGSQILARALGGEVTRMERLELGWLPVTLTGAGTNDIVHAGVGWTTVQLHWHRDFVSKLPPGATLLARSAACPVQAWSHGLRTYAFQYHPEVDADDLERWMADSPSDLTEAGIDAQTLRRQTAEHLPDMARVASRLFEAIALLVMPLDRRYAGITKDLHH